MKHDVEVRYTVPTGEAASKTYVVDAETGDEAAMLAMSDVIADRLIEPTIVSVAPSATVSATRPVVAAVEGGQVEPPKVTKPASKAKSKPAKKPATAKKPTKTRSTNPVLAALDEESQDTAAVTST